MLIAGLSDGRFIIGIDANNLRQLQAGRPMVVELSKHGGKDNFYVMYRDTLEQVAAELETANGGLLPPAQDLRTPRSSTTIPIVEDAATLNAVIEGGRELAAAVKALTKLHGEPIVHMATMMANAHHGICVMQDEGLPLELRELHARMVIDVVFDSYIKVTELDRSLVYKVAQGLHDHISNIQADAIIAGGNQSQGENDGAAGHRKP